MTASQTQRRPQCPRQRWPGRGARRQPTRRFPLVWKAGPFAAHFNAVFGHKLRVNLLADRRNNKVTRKFKRFAGGDRGCGGRMHWVRRASSDCRPALPSFCSTGAASSTNFTPSSIASLSSCSSAAFPSSCAGRRWWRRGRAHALGDVGSRPWQCCLRRRRPWPSMHGLTCCFISFIQPMTPLTLPGMPSSPACHARRLPSGMCV